MVPRRTRARGVLMTELNRYDAEWLADVQLGEEPRFFTEFFQPLSLTSDVFFAPSLRYELQTLQVVADGRRVARYRSRESEVGVRGRRGAVELGRSARRATRRGDGSAEVMIGDPALPRRDFDLGAAFRSSATTGSTAPISRSTARRSAWAGAASASRLGRAGTRTSCEAEWLMARSHKRYSVVFGMECGSALDDRVVSPQQLFTLGGFLKLSGLPSDAIAARSTASHAPSPTGG